MGRPVGRTVAPSVSLGPSAIAFDGVTVRGAESTPEERTMRPRLVVVGGGRMGTALVGGLVAAGWPPGSVTVVEADAGRRTSLAEILPGVPVVLAPLAADGAVVAVKPGDAESACRSLAAVGAVRVLSIMAGVPLANLEAWLGPSAAVVRAMPNTPALVGAGVSALAGGTHAGESDVAWAEEVLGAVGSVVRLPEPSLDAATGLSGSGPAYIFLVAEALIDAGVRVGLAREVSRTLALGTIAGAARLLLDTGEEPVTLRAQVTSPGGTTEAGVARLEANGLRRAFDEAVSAATERSRAMSGS
ncbi:MAG TPA: pyrroline-5-carboxylate reductase [Acidimicrobiales bacterium]|nr:pyrroline-5-carboxylate reductase [Acidimicrobiales bacterium]